MRDWPRGLIYAVLAAGVALSAVSLAAVLRSARQDVLVAHSEGRDDLVWYSNQFELELAQLIDTVELFRGDTGVPTADDVRDRFDVFWSRVSHAGAGSLGRHYAQFVGAAEAIAGAGEALVKLDPAFAAIETLAPGELQQVLDKLRALRPGLHELSMQALAERQREDAAHVGRLRAHGSGMVFLLLGLLVFGTGTALLLVRDRARLGALGEDLERRVQARTRELRESEQRFRLLFENAPEAIVVLDVDAGRFIDVNDNACALFGMDRESLLERGPRDVSPTQQPDGEPSEPAARTLIAQAVDGATPTFGWTHVNAQGEEIACEVRLVRMPAAGATRVRGSIVDVTELRKAERELARHRAELETLVEERTAELLSAQRELMRSERLAAIGELIGTVSHELRNPLGTISASFEVLRGRLGSMEPQTERIVERIERNIARCVLIIGELLDYARARELERTPIDVDGWLAGLVDELEFPAGVRLSTRLESGARVSLDTDRMRQALTNLVQNACQALAEGDPAHPGDAPRPGDPPEIRIGSRTADGHVEIVVADNGPGIDASTIEHVFEPLFSTRTFGVGLGLSLVRRIVEQHDGELALDSEPGRGATFTIRIPLRSAPPGPERA